MKKTTFNTTREDLKQIIDESKKIDYQLTIINDPNMFTVEVSIQAEEADFYEFIERHNLWKCIDEVLNN